MNSLTKNRLFALMKETAAAVDAFVLDELSTISRNSLPMQAVLHLPRIRAQPLGDRARPKLRATFVRLIFQMLSDNDWRTIVPLAAAGELLAVSSYVIDDLLDSQQMRNGELATWVVHGQAEAIMAAQIQREIAERILLKLDIPAARIIRLVAALNEIFFKGYLGQLLDSRMKMPSPMSYYINRCEYIGGHFHGGLARMAATFAGASEEKVEQLGRLGFWQGIALQIRNDLVDYLPASIIAEAGAHALERTPFEDFRNGKWSLPLLCAHEQADSQDRETLARLMSDRPFSDEGMERLIHVLIKTGAYAATLQEITAYKKKAEQLLLGFSESPTREAMAALLETVENARSYVDRLIAARPQEHLPP
jgi:geranylgeranyl pyrophosphate synthase